MDSFELYDKIEDYLKNQLSEAEKQAFEKDMQTNTALAEEVALHRDIINATNEPEIASFRQQMESILLEKPSPAKNTSLHAIKIGGWLVAASILIALAIWVFRPEVSKIETPIVDTGIDTTNSQNNLAEEKPIQSIDSTKTEKLARPERTLPQQGKIQPENQTQYLALAETAYQPFDGGIRGTEYQDTATLSNLEKAEIYYSEARLQEVIHLLQNPDQDQRTEALKLRAHTYFQLRQFNKSASDFEELTKISPLYQFDAEWNLLLSYLAQLPKTQAQFNILLNKITSDPNHPFAKKANELQRKI